MKAKKHRKLLMKSYRKATGLPLPVAALAAKLVARGALSFEGKSETHATLAACLVTEVSLARVMDYEHEVYCSVVYLVGPKGQVRLSSYY